MTDEESRKAYEAHFEAHGNDCWRNCSLAVWQASAEYHTKRERERCLDVLRDCASADTSVRYAIHKLEGKI